jgi:hypothetical protein
MIDLTSRAEALDKMRLKDISKKLSLEEAQNIVSVWGKYLEYTGSLRLLFGLSIPKSTLPYPVEILQGAINKMEAFYFDRGQLEKVKLLEETEVLLLNYCDDEAIKESISIFSNTKWQEAFIPVLGENQITQSHNGYLIDQKLWGLSKSRIEELLR